MFSAKKKFSRVWVASGSAIFPGQPLRDTELANERYLQQMKCSDVECLRNAEAEDLLEAVPDTWRKSSPDLPGVLEEPDKRHQWLALDGNILKEHPADVWAKENNNNEQGANGEVNMVIGKHSYYFINQNQTYFGLFLFYLISILYIFRSIIVNLFGLIF